MTAPRVNKEKGFPEIPREVDKTTVQPPEDSTSSNPDSVVKNAGRIQFEKVPKALKNGAKLLMKVVTAPPAVFLVGVGHVLGPIGFFMRAAPIALGGAIGEKIGSVVETEDKTAPRRIGRLAGFILFSPITVPALALEMLGAVAFFAGTSLVANIFDKMDLAVTLKHEILSQSGPRIMRDYVTELMKKNPSITREEINVKVKEKLRNQPFEKLEFDEEDFTSFRYGIMDDLEKKREPGIEKLKQDFNKSKAINTYINGIEKEARTQCEKLKLSPEFTNLIVNRAKRDAVLYVNSKLPIYVTEKELREKCEEIGLPENFIKEIIRASSDLLKKAENARREKLEPLKQRFINYEMTMSDYINAVGEASGNEAKEEALLYALHVYAASFFQMNPKGKYEFKEDLLTNIQQKTGLPEDAIEKARTEAKKILKEAKVIENLSAHVKKMEKLIPGNEIGAVQVFLERPESKPLLKNETLKELLRVHCDQRFDISREDLDFVLSNMDKISKRKKEL